MDPSSAPQHSRIEAIRARRAAIDAKTWQWELPIQVEVRRGRWLIYARGPEHPAESEGEKEEAWARAMREQAAISMLPADIDYLLALIDDLTSKSGL